MFLPLQRWIIIILFQVRMVHVHNIVPPEPCEGIDETVYNIFVMFPSV